MLYPQQNDLRNVQDLSGFWDFQLDPTDVGEEQGWCRGLAAPRAIAVPASWNEQFQDTHDYLGTAWYARTFQVSRTWQGQRVFLRFASANYEARVWLNGEPLGEHLGGHLPFAFEVTDRIAWGGVNTLAVRVNAELCPTRVPPGNVRGGMGGFFSSHPAASFDFYPYAG
ncbi:MAG: beta-galactosidase, partial [Chloroflexi bacterium]|nr:beta-galactosidase [Chloroflexota bacterium]